jgi:prepilin-type N-terminal cleavage/methylation domain-containing protein
LLAKLIKRESGYSLVEVMVSIVIMTVALLPMVSMFDMGLHSAGTGSNYDKARAFANSELEQAHKLAYADVRDSFPVASSTPNYTSSALAVPASAGLPSGSTYTVAKQYVVRPQCAAPTCAPQNWDLTGTTDQGLIRVTVTVNWANNSYTAFGLVAQ